MTGYSYNAGKGASAYYAPGQTRVVRGGGMTTSSPNVGHTFKSFNKPGSGLSGFFDAILEFFSN
jgi:hypothetical protein